MANSATLQDYKMCLNSMSDVGNGCVLDVQWYNAVSLQEHSIKNVTLRT
jgi:hypothetical protein